MNPQEFEQLNRFLNQLCDARVIDRNPEADALIREAVIKQPDAAYLLVQRAMLVEQALNGAKAQIAQLQNQLHSSQASSKSSFLGGTNPWAQAGDNASGAAFGSSGNSQPPRPAPLANATGGASSFLGNVATTAAGVVAGSFLFQGIENLLGHHQSPTSWGEATAEHLPEQTTINNYYASDQANPWQQHEDGNSFAASDADDDFIADNGDDSTWV
jgi:hypothetical protein